MTSDSLQPKSFPGLTVAEASCSHQETSGRGGALLRALLAGAMALLVLLLPAQLAA